MKSIITISLIFLSAFHTCSELASQSIEYQRNGPRDLTEKVVILNGEKAGFRTDGKADDLSAQEIDDIFEMTEKAFTAFKTTTADKHDFTVYKFQYFPFLTNSNEKIIEINAFCDGDSVWRRDSWRKSPIFVFDGGSCYWQTTVNLTRKQIAEITPNGVA